MRLTDAELRIGVGCVRGPGSTDICVVQRVPVASHAVLEVFVVVLASSDFLEECRRLRTP